MTGAPFDSLALPRHPIHVSVDDTGFAASCTCGFRASRPTRELRDIDINEHLSVRRSRGSHGVVPEGD